MNEDKLQIRLRLIIIKKNKLLTSYTKKHDFYFYVGGHLEYGETILEGCKREIVEECGKGTEFKLQKVLYIRDFFDTDHNEQNVELFILGDINKFEELEHRLDSQHADGSMWLTWLDINSLPDNLFPKPLSKKLLEDYKKGFPQAGEYVGKMESI
ncbi:MAG TPA: NUDIX domain-containing protein [Patescibacteria group bacterium]|nr:NUDIX domain-containing protein [Patescibacteria group bacterium]